MVLNNTLNLIRIWRQREWRRPQEWRWPQEWRQPQEWRWPLSKSLVLALGILVSLSGCAAPPSALTLLPVTGSAPVFQVHEYAIAEQSKDNPTHLEFQQRVQAAVTAQQAGWHFPGPQDLVKSPNAALAPFHYRLAINPTPPFSAYALYHNNQLVQRDIAHFWPISLKSGANGADFLLAFETLDGQKLVASQDGIHNWIDVGNNPTGSISRTPPVFYGDQIAYAETSSTGAINVYSGGGLLYSGSTQPGSQARDLYTWADTQTSGAARQHWALQMDGRVIMDGKDLNQANGSSEIFGWQLINGQPFYFYAKNGSYHLKYAGRDLPFSYDQIVHGNTGPIAIYNPGSTDNIVWFYALRDGLWYYVEVGDFN